MKKRRLRVLLVTAALSVLLSSCTEDSSGFETPKQTTSQTAASQTQTEQTEETKISSELITSESSSQTQNTDTSVSETASDTHKTTTSAEKTTTTEKTTKATTKAATTTTKATTAKKQQRIIPATELADMTTAQLKAIIGNNYRADREGDHFGVTSDYFPHVFIAYNGISTLDGIKNAFDHGDNYVNIAVLQGGLIGDNAYVGDSFKKLLTTVECLGAVEVSRDWNGSESIVGGHRVTLRFDNQQGLQKLATAQSGDSDFHYVKVDASGINCKSTLASLYVGCKYDGKTGSKATVISTYAPINMLCSEDSPVLWNMKKGETVYVGSSMSGARGPIWYPVYGYTTSSGKIKKGFVNGKYLKVFSSR